MRDWLRSATDKVIVKVVVLVPLSFGSKVILVPLEYVLLSLCSDLFRFGVLEEMVSVRFTVQLLSVLRFSTVIVLTTGVP